MRTVVPFDATDPKSRLSDVLDSGERAAFAAAMCRDVLGAIRRAGGAPEVVTTATLDFEVDAPVTVDDRPLSACVNAALDGVAPADPVAVVMADLALATPAALDRLFDAGGDVAIAPGRGGGTNGLVVAHPEFRVDYHGASCLDHRRAARDLGADLREVDSFRLATDVDERSDLVEVLVHGDGEAARWLRGAGFELAADGGRVTARRDDRAD